MCCKTVNVRPMEYFNLMFIILFQEVKREEIEQQMALASNPGRRDDRDRERDRRRLRDNRSSQIADEGWSVASTKGRQFDSSRLKTLSKVSTLCHFVN